MKQLIDRLLAQPEPVRTLDWPGARAELIEKLSDRLAPYGLRYQSALNFFEEESDADGLRRMFRIHDAGAGRALTANWGYGLDIAPHIAAGRMAWHRTFASARRDLWFFARSGTPAAHRTLGRAHYYETIFRVIDDGIERGRAFWNETRDLPALTERLKGATWQMHDVAHGTDSHIARRSPLSLAFALARMGDPAAEDELERTLRAFDLTPGSADRLRDALERT